jgi:hypothetical protein
MAYYDPFPVMHHSTQGSSEHRAGEELVLDMSCEGAPPSVMVRQEDEIMYKLYQQRTALLEQRRQLDMEIVALDNHLRLHTSAAKFASAPEGTNGAALANSNRGQLLVAIEDVDPVVVARLGEELTWTAQQHAWSRGCASLCWT